MEKLAGVVEPRQPLLGDVRQLERDFQRIVQGDSLNADACFVVGMLALRDGRDEQAAESIRRAIGLNPANADYHYSLGAALFRLGRPEEAVASYQQALRLRPDFPEAHNDLGKLLASRGRLEEAMAAYRRALHVKPDFAEAHFNLGAALEAQGRLEEAAAAFGESAHLRPDHPDVLKSLGVVHTRLGKLDEAAAAYQQVLRLRPDDPDVHNELGIIYSRQGRLDDAVAAYREAIRCQPRSPDAHNNLGNALRNQGKVDEAIACLQEALRLRPEYPEAHNNLGIALKHKGRIDDAIASYNLALEMRPNYPETHNNLGIALAERGNLDAAVVCFQQAIRLRTDYVEAHANLANALADQNRLPEAVESFRRAMQIRPGDPHLHKNLGIALSKMDRFDEAAASFREAIRIWPEFADAHNDLGIVLSRQNKFDEAEVSYQEAIRLRPNYAEAMNNLGNALRGAGRFVESLEHYQKAVKLRPNYADAYNNLGIANSEMGRFDEAVASYTQCLKLRPTHVDAHLNRSLTWLRQGNFAQGWAEYEWRWRKRPHPHRTIIQPLWNGADPAGRRILLITEQGFGDTIHFIRYAKKLREQGASVILECAEPLVKLMGWVPGIDQIVTRESAPPPDHDVYCPLLNLPGLMGSSPESFPAEVPYIFPDSALVEHWRRELAEMREFKVGIQWQGNPGYAGDRHRSIRLADFEPLARVPGVRLISLQKNEGSEQLQEVAGKFPVTDLGSRLDVSTGPFLDTAAVLKNLDLFITCDTAVAHLAGALGVRTWVALSATPDWRWLVLGEDSVWYPTMRLFRQQEYLVWRPVLERMAAELRNLVPASLRTQPIYAAIAPAELLDRITQLEVEATNLKDQERARSVQIELEGMRAAREQSVTESEELAALIAELKGVNLAIWTAEEGMRECERAGDFGPGFVELARAASKAKEERAAIKRRINEHLGYGVHTPPSEPLPCADRREAPKTAHIGSQGAVSVEKGESDGHEDVVAVKPARHSRARGTSRKRNR